MEIMFSNDLFLFIGYRTWKKTGTTS